MSLEMKTALALVMNPVQGVSEKDIFQDDCYFNGRNSVYNIEKAIDSELNHIREVSPAGRHYTRYSVATPEQVRKIATFFNGKYQANKHRRDYADFQPITQEQIEQAVKLVSIQ